METEGVRDEVFQCFLRHIESECTVLCQKESPSLFRRTSAKEIDQFNWRSLHLELEMKAPLLLKVLSMVAIRTDARCEPRLPMSHHPAVVTSSAVLLKARNREMCGLQFNVSCLLYACHCEKQVKHQT